MAGLTKLHFTNKAAHFDVKNTLGKQNLLPKDFKFCQKNFRFFANNYCIGMFVETSSWTPGGIVWRKKILGKISIICSHLSTFFGFRSMFFLILVQISRQGHQKVFSTCPDEQFEKGYSTVFKNFQFCYFCIKKLSLTQTKVWKQTSVLHSYELEESSEDNFRRKKSFNI